MEELRCKSCSRFLGKASNFNGELKCKSCKKVSRFHVVSQKSLYTDYLTKEN